MARAPLYRGRPVSALLITVFAVLAAAYVALAAPVPEQPEPATLTIESPRAVSAGPAGPASLPR